MSIGLDYFIEVKINDKWELHEETDSSPDKGGLFSYGEIPFLTGFNNYGLMPTLDPGLFYLGYPTDSDYLNEKTGYIHYNGEQGTRREDIQNSYNYAISYVTLKQLLEIDYTQTYLDVTNINDRNKPLPINVAPRISLIDSLGAHYANSLKYLCDLETEGKTENIRIVYWLS